ncbi:MAG: nucleotide exchange factor GrpE [Clostridiaceae bacterium]|nr:nucleotide exchange factor GrpE [Clostridiaceae bacterium]
MAEYVNISPELENEDIQDMVEDEVCDNTTSVGQEEVAEEMEKEMETEDEEKTQLKKQIEDMNAYCSEMKDKMLRMAAEFDNYKKRTSREMDNIYTDAKCDTVKNILPVIDNFERALETGVCESCSSYKQGVELIYKQLMDILSSMGVEEIKALGEKFNPDFHNAVMHVEDENASANEIVEVFQKGYKLNDRVIRYSMVKVAN